MTAVLGHLHEIGIEGDMLLGRSNMLEIERGPIPYASTPLRDTFDEVYGVQTTSEHPKEGGWFVEQRSPESDDEKLLVNMEYPPVFIYITLSGLNRAIKNWPGELAA